jgi:hypothetical protein
MSGKHSLCPAPSVILAGTVLALVAFGAPHAKAWPLREFQQAELSELNPEKCMEVESRITGVNTASGALDFGRGTLVHEVTGGQLRTTNFDKHTLVIKD